MQRYSAISSSVSVEYQVAPPITPLCYRALIAEPYSKYGLLSMHYAIMGSELIDGAFSDGWQYACFHLLCIGPFPQVTCYVPD